jgi:type VI secretion system protein
MQMNVTEIVRSVVNHLRKMLNTKQNHAPAHMDYGIPDPSDVAHSLPDAIGTMQKCIRQCIEKYEPRLTNVNVIHVESELDILTLRFQITAQLVHSKERVPIVFDTLVDSSGRIKVKD